MSKKKKVVPINISERKEINRVNPDYRTGLTSSQVRERQEAGWNNREVDASLLSVPDIIKKNVCTYFNLIFAVLAVLLCLVGSEILPFFLWSFSTPSWESCRKSAQKMYWIR